MAKKVSPAKSPIPRIPGVSGKRKQGKKLQLAERFRVIEVHKQHPDWSYATVGEACGVSKDTARLTVLAAGKNAVDLMQAFSAPMVEDWAIASHIAARRGDHRPARDWLLHAGIIEPLPDNRQPHGPSVIILNAPLPGLPGSELRILEPHTDHSAPRATRVSHEVDGARTDGPVFNGSADRAAGLVEPQDTLAEPQDLSGASDALDAALRSDST